MDASLTIEFQTPPTAATANFSHLPYLVTQKIFDYLPLKDVIHSDEVCKEWNTLKCNALKRKTRLVLANQRKDARVLTLSHYLKKFTTESPNNGGNCVETYLEGAPLLRDLLVYGDYWEEELCTKIFLLLPNLKEIQLVSVLKEQTRFIFMLNLLYKYKDTLQTLKMIFSEKKYFLKKIVYYSELSQSFIFKLLSDFLNNLCFMTVLKQLNLKINFPFPYESQKFVKMCILPVAKQLEKCSVSITNLRGVFLNEQFFDDKETLFTNLTMIAETNQNLKKFCLHTPFKLETLISFEPRAKTLIEDVLIGETININNFEKFNLFALQFVNLKILAITFHPKQPWKNVLNALTHCKKLKTLSLKVLFDCFNPSGDETIDADNNMLLPVLPSVQFLYLWLHSTNHTELTSQPLEIIFPNVLIIRFKQIDFRCKTCNFFGICKTSECLQKVNNCHRQIRMSFNRFPNLIALITNYGVKHYSEEFRYNQLFTKDTLDSGAVEIQVKNLPIKNLLKLFKPFSNSWLHCLYLQNNLFFLKQNIFISKMD